ncbi:MAG: hypothetical protein K6U04_12640 [Armatimonadetes bacterium]|nr:hypothetical protein [Armatimonadota bacterium]
MTAEIIILEARIRRELFQLQKIAGELKAVLKPYKQKPVKDSTVLRALGSILHDFYSGIEKIFLQIAREIDQSAPKGENWHRLLLEQMTLHLKGRRPPVIGIEIASKLQQYLAFRHRFRNLYGFELEWERMEELVRALPETLQELSVAIDSFLALLETADDDE